VTGRRPDTVSDLSEYKETSPSQAASRIGI